MEFTELTTTVINAFTENVTEVLIDLTNSTTVAINASEPTTSIPDSHGSESGAGMFPDIMRVMYIILAIIGILGNLLVVYIIMKNPKMQTVTNIHILNLSIIDALIMAGLLIRDHSQWSYGYGLCKAYVGLTAIADFGGVFQIAALSGDRCIALCYPIRSIKYRTLRTSYYVCGFVWLLSVLFSVPIIYYGDLRRETLGDSCSVFWDNGSNAGERAYFTYTTTFGFVIPVIIIAISYIMILWKLRNFGFEDKNSKRIRKVTMFVIIVIGVYLLLWVPYWATNLYYAFIHRNPSSEHEFDFVEFVIKGIAEYVSYVHSAFNPVLYVFINNNFKANLLKMFPFICKTRVIDEDTSYATDGVGGKLSLREARTNESTLA